jgi:hypothetical protein
MGVFMTFDSHGRIQEMTIAVVDLPGLTERIRSAVRAGLANAA